MEHKLIKPIAKANGEQIESVTVKESFVGKDLKDTATQILREKATR